MNRQADGPRGTGAAASILRAIAGAAAAIDPIAFVLVSWWLALVSIAVLQQAHDGLHERLELAPLLHILRDASLAVPAAAIAVACASVAVHGAFGDGRPRIVGRLVWVAVATVTFALLSMPGNALHGALFGAEEEEGISPLLDLVVDGGLALVGGLLALIPYVLVIGPPTATSAGRPVPEPSRRHRPGRGDVVARSSH